MQRQLWLAEQLAGGAARYNIAEAFALSGPIDYTALSGAIDLLVLRHEALRAVIAPDGASEEQTFAEPRAGVLQRLDVGMAPVEQAGSEARRIVLSAARDPFDLAQGLLVRAVLVTLAPERHLLGLTVHHSAADGWSMDLLLSELGAAYGTLAGGGAMADTPGRVDFGDVLVWQSRAGGADRRDTLLRWWSERLAGAPARLSFQAPAPAGQRSAFAGLVTGKLDADQVGRIRSFAREQRTTTFVVMLAAWQALLSRWTGQRDVVVGCPVWGRGSSALEPVVGCFVNLLPIRVDVAVAASFSDLVPKVRAAMLGACTHGELAYSDVVATQGGRPLVQVAFSLNRKRSPLKLAGLDVRPIALERGAPKFDLLLETFEETDGIRLELEHDDGVVDGETAARVLQAFVTLLSAAVEQSSTPVASLPVMPAAERHRVVETFNATAVPYPRDAALHDLVREQVDRSPDAVAVVCGDVTSTYHKIWNESQVIAARLRELGVEPDDRVAVCMERSPALVPALLGVLSAGGCYVPLDSRHPLERLKMMCEDARPRCVVAGAATAAVARALGVPVLLADALDGSPAAPLIAPAGKVSSSAERLAYVCYTSGSTGRPKGVAVPHRGVVRLVRGSSYVSFDPRHVFLHHSPLAFDASTFEIWGPLVNGGRVVMAPPGTPDLNDLVRLIGCHRVTTAFFTTALFNLLVDERLEGIAPLDQLVFGGEACSPDHVARASRGLPRCRLVHAYGPTESTTFATCNDVAPADIEAGAFPIGGPIANTTAYVLDPSGQPLPPGVAGELHLGGDGVARGYLGQPALSEERFIPDPFRGGVMYRTGDLARWRSDGRLEFMARVDDQVKIRGFRVEPSEIEGRLIAHPGVARAHVGTLPDSCGGKRLVAWVVPAGDAAGLPDRIAASLATSLPEYMIPSAIVCVERLPLTPSGKVDRAALPTPGPVVTVRLSPRDELEEQLVALWEDVLNVRGFGVLDSFFDLGGHSLLAAKLAARIEASMGVRLPLITFFEARTIAELASRIRRGDCTRADRLVVPLQPRGDRPPIFWIHSLGGDRTGSFMYYRPLVPLLGDDRPSYGIRSPETPCDTVEAMGAAYAQAIAAQYPVGPVMLGGFCVGGVAAYEVARHLTAAGRHVALLVMIDSMPALEASPATGWMSRLGAATRTGLLSAARRARRLLSRRARGVAGAHRIWELLDRETYPEECARAAEVHWDALQAYSPGPYAGRVVLFRPRSGPRSEEFWGRSATGELRVVEIDAGHDLLLQRPALDTVAAVLCELTAEVGSAS